MSSSPQKNDKSPLDPSQLAPGTVVDGRYKIVRVIGVGGTGIVYRVEHHKTGQLLALKTLLDAAQAPRLEQEARALARLKSPHIVKVVDLGVHTPPRTLGQREPPYPFMVMSLLQGRNLRQVLEANVPLDLRFVANVVVQVAEGLAEAHEAGLVHRDLKPDNVQLATDTVDVARIAEEHVFATVFDFGVVKLTAAELNNPLTRTGATVGTPYYMSLEQLRGAGTVDAQTDIYALAVMVYECLAGKRPFEAGTLGDLIFAICSTSPTPLREARPELPEEIDQIVTRGLSREKGDRPSSMREVAQAFAPYADPAFTLWLRDTKLSAVQASTVPPLSSSGPRPIPRDPPEPPTAPLPALAPPATPVALRPLPAPLPPPSSPRAAPPPKAPEGSTALTPVSGGAAAAVPASGAAAAPRPPRPPLRDEPTDRETPTEMFVQGVHDAQAPADETDDDDPPTGIASGRDVGLPKVGGPPASSEDRTAVLTIADVMLGSDAADPKTADLAPAFGPAPSPSSSRGGVGAPGASLPAAPTSAPQSAMLEQRPPHLQTQQLAPTAFVKAQQTVRVPQSATVTQVPSPVSRNPDALAEFLDKARIRGTAAAERAMLRFRAATPEQQVVVVAVGTAAIAVFVVLLFWAAFLR